MSLVKAWKASGLSAAQSADQHFLNGTELDWYTTFRSLIASCHLHGIDPQLYIEEVLRLAPHWPATLMLQLSPKYWQQTRAALSPEQLATIRSPWDKTAASATRADARDGPAVSPPKAA